MEMGLRLSHFASILLRQQVGGDAKDSPRCRIYFTNYPSDLQHLLVRIERLRIAKNTLHCYKKKHVKPLYIVEM